MTRLRAQAVITAAIQPSHSQHVKFIRILSEAKYLHWDDLAAKVMAEDLWWLQGFGCLPGDVTINTPRSERYGDAGALKHNQAWQFSACQKGQAPRLASISPEDSQKGNSGSWTQVQCPKCEA